MKLINPCVGIRNLFGKQRRLYLTTDTKNKKEILSMCREIVKRFNQSDYVLRKTKEGYAIFFFNLLTKEEWIKQLTWVKNNFEKIVDKEWYDKHAVDHDSNIRFLGKYEKDLGKCELFRGNRRLTNEEKTIIEFLRGDNYGR